MKGPRIGVDALGLAIGGGLTWLDGLVPALARVWPEARISVLVRRGVTPAWAGTAGVRWRALRTPSGAARMAPEWLGVPVWAAAERLDAVLAAADAGPAACPCRLVQTVQNAKIYLEGGARYRLLLRAARATARAAATTVFVSEAVRAVAEPRLAPRRVAVVRHGLVPPRAVDAPSPLPGPYVLSVATPYAHKDLATALEAVLRLRRAGRRETLALVGGGGDARVVAALCERAGSDPGALTLVGPVAPAALSAYYAHAAAFVLPSRVESYGLPLAEALCHGVPSVASDVPALVETGAGACAHHPVGDASVLSARLLEALADPADADARRARGARFAAAWTWEDAARGYRAALEGRTPENA